MYGIREIAPIFDKVNYFIKTFSYSFLYKNIHMYENFNFKLHMYEN